MVVFDAASGDHWILSEASDQLLSNVEAAGWETLHWPSGGNQSALEHAGMARRMERLDELVDAGLLSLEQSEAHGTEQLPLTP